MNYRLNNLLFFVAGAAIGSVVTWKLVKTKYEQLAQEEIDSVREYYGKSRKNDEVKEESEPAEDEDDYIEAESERCEKIREATILGVDISNRPDIQEYARKVGAIGYGPREDKKEMDIIRPYVISPEQFEEFEDYDVVTLTYYADGVLTDEQDHRIEDVKGIVGEDSLTRFGEYEKDTVYVRNDTLKCYYEILRDIDKYSELYPGE